MNPNYFQTNQFPNKNTHKYQLLVELLNRACSMSLIVYYRFALIYCFILAITLNAASCEYNDTASYSRSR